MAPFASKFVNYLSHSELLKNAWTWINRRFRRKMSPISNSCECSKAHCASNNWQIWTQKVPKEAWRFELLTSLTFFSKVLCCSRFVDSQKLGQYIRMLCTGWFILNGIVLLLLSIKKLLTHLSNKSCISGDEKLIFKNQNFNSIFKTLRLNSFQVNFDRELRSNVPKIYSRIRIVPNATKNLKNKSSYRLASLFVTPWSIYADCITIIWYCFQNLWKFEITT